MSSVGEMPRYVLGLWAAMVGLCACSESGSDVGALNTSTGASDESEGAVSGGQGASDAEGSTAGASGESGDAQSSSGGTEDGESTGPNDGGEGGLEGVIVFETDFRHDGEFFDSGTGNLRYSNVPQGWDGIRTNNGTIRGVPGAGIDGSVALKFEWPGTTTALATSLFKHLTGDPSTGYEELYIRYQVRLPEAFEAGTPDNPLPYWKWGRLWQNTGLEGDGWTENRPDSYFIVWNWGNGLPRWGIRNGLTFSENLGTNDLGSAGSPRTGPDWYVSGGDATGHHVGFDGHWDNVGGGSWEFDHDSRGLIDPQQGWHTFEWRFQLSSSDTANDGVFQVWFDGVEQFVPNPIDGIEQPLDQPSTPHSLITAAKPGFNMFVLFDNMAEWSRAWSEPGVEGGIYVNDVVISTGRIGPEYVVGEASAYAPPRRPSLDAE